MVNPFLQLSTYAVPGLVIAGGLLLGLTVRRTVLPRLARLAAKSDWHYDDVLVDAVRGPVVIWCMLLAIRIALRILPFTAATDRWLGRTVLVLAIFSVTWAAARFTAGALRARASGGALQGVTLIANVTRAVIYAFGILIILQSLGISITPLLTALGVGGLAVGLALQPTLANFFSGIRILAAGKIRPGDYVRLESGLEGVVADVTWAQTTIRQLSNNLVIVPNAKLAESITTNYSLPDQQLAVVIPVSVAYGSDLAQVEAVALDVAARVQAEVAGAVRGAEAVVRFHSFGDSAVQLNVIVHAGDFEQRALVASECIKRLYARFRAEGIEIPFPMRTVIMKSGG